MPVMRCSPQSGIHCTLRISASAAARRPARSMPMNHCGVARKITGVLCASSAGSCVGRARGAAAYRARAAPRPRAGWRRTPSPGEERRGCEEAAVVADRVVHGQAVAASDDEVLLAVTGRGVHGTRTAVERHVLAQDHCTSRRRTGGAGAGPRAPRLCAAHFVEDGCPGTLQHRRDELGREQQQLAAVGRLDLEQRVLELRVQRDRLVGGSVHGVVVQMTTLARSPCSPTPPSLARDRPGPRPRSAPSIEGEVRSSYSTSASASAERQSRHQCTGL